MRVSGSECWIRGSGLRISMLHGMFHKLQGFPGFHKRLMGGGGGLGLRVSKGAYEIQPRPFIRRYNYDLSKSRNPEPKTQTPKTPNPTRDSVFVLSHLRLSANCFAYFRVRFMIVDDRN